METPILTLADFEERFADRHLIHGVVDKWANVQPHGIALIDAGSKRKVSWIEFQQITSALAGLLLELGFVKGDCFASVLPLTVEHIFLEYSCFRIGVIFVPLDLRLPPADLLRSLNLIKAKGFAFLRIPGAPDSFPLCQQIQSQLQPKVLLQFSTNEEIVSLARSAASLFDEIARLRNDLTRAQALLSRLESASRSLSPEDGALAIFTTGSTGSPKPALLSHKNVACQAMCISQTLLRSEKPLVTLVNLPPSHVGCQTELLMGTLFHGGSAVLVPIFDALRSVKTIEVYGVTAIGQIPAMFQFEWRLKEYSSFDFSSLEFVAYGGQQVSVAFLKKMAEMAPTVGTGLGLTETAGFCTYIKRPRGQAEDCASTLGEAMPVYPMSIREPMREDGSAGAELPDGQIGHVCFRGPQTFLGYMNDPHATAAAISTDGHLYTGDLGFHAADGLHLSGRAKFVLKPAGYQVFPRDVEEHFSALPEVGSSAAVGVPHPTLAEAILLFIEKKPDAAIERSQLERHARGLASYMRPRHYVILEPGKLPLNRVAKADYLALKELANREVAALTAQGTWGKDRD